MLTHLARRVLWRGGAGMREWSEEEDVCLFVRCVCRPHASICRGADKSSAVNEFFHVTSLPIHDLGSAPEPMPGVTTALVEERGEVSFS